MRVIPRNYYVGLSLIITSGYYFNNYTLFAVKNYLIFFLDLFLLFFVSLFLFLLIIKFIIQNKNRNYLKNILYTYFFVQITKALVFLTYGKITLSDLIIRLLNHISEDLNINRMIIFAFPYLFTFIVLSIINNKKERINYLNFFRIFGFVLFFIVIYREGFNSIEFNKGKTDIIKNEHVKLDNVNNSKKVIWILFDGFDPQIYEKYKNKLKLDNLKHFEDKSVFAPNSFSPSIKTIDSVPSMLMGKKTFGHFIKNNKYYLVTNENKKILFSFNNSIFGNLYKNNLNSSILSSVIQYCSSYIKSKKYFLCVEPDKKKEKVKLNKILSGINFAYSPYSKIKFIINKFYKTEKKQVLNKIDFENINLSVKTSDIEDFDGYNTVNFTNYSLALKNSNFIFMHLYVPHPGNFGYAEKLFGIYSEDELDSHLLNLKITDIAIGKIYKEIQKYENYMMVISSDHWFRAKDKNKNNIYPSLFMATTNENLNNFKLSKEFKNLNIKELIYKYFNNEVNMNEDIKFFIEEKE